MPSGMGKKQVFLSWGLGIGVNLCLNSFLSGEDQKCGLIFALVSKNEVFL
jgi:hypothetical protein